MLCPYCNFENIAGADTCEGCSQDLTSHEQLGPQSEMEQSILETSVAHLGPKIPLIVAPDTSVGDVITILQENHIGCVLVGSAERIEGIFSERDALNKVAGRFGEVAPQPISRFMTPDPETLDANTPIAFALNEMSVGHFRHLPITYQRKLEGVISIRDMLQFLSSKFPDLIRAS